MIRNGLAIFPPVRISSVSSVPLWFEDFGSGRRPGWVSSVFRPWPPLYPDLLSARRAKKLTVCITKRLAAVRVQFRGQVGLQRDGRKETDR